MSRARRLGLLGAAVALLALVALLLSSSDGGSGAGDSTTAGASVEAESRDPARLLARLSEQAEARRQGDLRREDPHGEPGPTGATLRSWRRIEREVEPVARHFHSAFSRYELGLPATEALRQTATPGLTRSLLRAPPRPPRAESPDLARLGRLELLPVAAEGGRLTRVELVGQLRRGGRSEPIAIELRRTSEGWRVVGLGL